VVAGGIFLAIGAAYGGYWWSVGRHDVATDDAYVAGDVIPVAPQISGTVTSILADDTDAVAQGQPLVTLDDTDSRVALDLAKARLAETARDVRAMVSRDAALAAAAAVEETNLARAQEDLARRQRLADTGAVAAEELKHARDTVQQAAARLINARRQFDANHVLIERTTLATHPRVLQAAAQLREAYLAWRRTTILAPVAGQVAKRAVQVGQRPAPGTPLMAIIPLSGVWVDANFKERQLGAMRIGQPVLLTADLYGGSVEFHGRVVGLSAGTGSAFSLLPAQNATGNWIKVVQRVPVRIALDPAELAAHPLRVGLSMEAHVDIRDQSGAQLAAGRQRDVTAATPVFTDLDHEADAIIHDILAASE